MLLFADLTEEVNELCLKLVFRRHEHNLPLRQLTEVSILTGPNGQGDSLSFGRQRPSSSSLAETELVSNRAATGSMASGQAKLSEHSVANGRFKCLRTDEDGVFTSDSGTSSHFSGASDKKSAVRSALRVPETQQGINSNSKMLTYSGKKRRPRRHTKDPQKFRDNGGDQGETIPNFGRKLKREGKLRQAASRERPNGEVGAAMQREAKLSVCQNNVILLLLISVREKILDLNEKRMKLTACIFILA
ncbi:unnamed protein product [Protopolystoma xenopodis]|uniref:Uncharacterized protein n=1 Tax=Protopolystoma xenopodis TaxID=117903 RepID=A0A3S5CSN8_9PLAT|nr:unnamed protein product [Protopolystoma xenopodis]